MGLPEQQAAVARLLTDRRYLDRFFGSAPDAHAEFGLSRDEYASMRTLDPKRLGISSEGYAGKRFERLMGSFPRTFARFVLTRADARSAYLARTAFPPTEAAEFETFAAYLRAWDVPAEARRALLDLHALEAALLRPAAPLRPFRYRPERLRPARAAHAIVVASEGPLDALLRDPATPAYPEEPGRWLLVARAPALRLQLLDGLAAAAWSACDGARTAEEVLRGLPDAEPLLLAWLEAGVVEDAG